MSSRSPVSSTRAKRVLGASSPSAGGGCRPAAGASPLAEADPVGEVLGGSAAEFVGSAEELAPGDPIGGSADSWAEPGSDCPPVPDSPPTTIVVPAGRSVSPSTVTEPATGLLAETRRSDCGALVDDIHLDGRAAAGAVHRGRLRPGRRLREGDLGVADGDAVHRDRRAGRSCWPGWPSARSGRRHSRRAPPCWRRRRRQGSRASGWLHGSQGGFQGGSRRVVLPAWARPAERQRGRRCGGFGCSSGAVTRVTRCAA